jgi:hypothetical protein
MTDLDIGIMPNVAVARHPRGRRSGVTTSPKPPRDRPPGGSSASHTRPDVVVGDSCCGDRQAGGIGPGVTMRGMQGRATGNRSTLS